MNLKKIPYPTSAVILSIFTLGNLILTEDPATQIIRNIFGVLAGLLYILYLVRVFSDLPTFHQTIKTNPIIASVVITWPMATALFAQYLLPFMSGFSKILWYLALILYVILLFQFILNHIVKDFKLQKVFASWFVPFCAPGVWSITAPAFEALKIGQICFYFGFISLLILSPLIIYRVLKYPVKKPGEIPTTAIFAAPAALQTAGYIQSFPEKNKILLFILIAITVLYYIIGLFSFIKNMMKPFNPSFAAYTFPMVISGMAIKMSLNVLNKIGYNFSLNFLALATQWIAIIAVTFVFVPYIKLIFLEK